MKAVVLFSGGLDSTTVLYVARRDGREPVCLSISYGQLHERELLSAKKIASSLKLEHWIIPVSLPWGGSALTDSALAVPKGRAEEEIKQGIPVTYVPARNSIFLSLAASLAEAKGADSIYFGANALDYSGYPDCRPEFIQAFEKMITLGTKIGVMQQNIGLETTTVEAPLVGALGAGTRPAPTNAAPIRIIAPLLKLSKAGIVKLGSKLGVPFEWTWSCYEGKEIPCGECDSCILRAKGFREVGIEDPLCRGNPLWLPLGRAQGPAPTIKN